MQNELFKIAARIPNAPTDLLAAALPVAGNILENGRTGQKSLVIMLLFEVARRPDGLILLKPYLPEILACLRDPKPGMAPIIEYILAWLFPQPVGLVVPYLIDYVSDEQVDEESRVGGIATLVWYAPCSK